ncbi:MAG: Flp family type IVb pilin [Kordiimonadaceae bacterium]|nr:Flp family type IVb pilin [Kordiimonadaceae bacterium]MBO6568952.1 Flp family type IVb pilin [Kordiimonadaceae bacterium]MBO6965073.1 Flp family type IVb pilin [Kordiimonadaceae bacterium]
MSGTIEHSADRRRPFAVVRNIGFKLRVSLCAFCKNTSGATAVEYGLLAGLVAIGLAGGLGALADLVSLLFDTIGDEAAEVSAAMNDGGG